MTLPVPLLLCRLERLSLLFAAQGGFHLDGLSSLLLFILHNMPFDRPINKIPQLSIKGNYILMNKL